MKVVQKFSGIALALPLMVACSTYDLDAINDQTVDDWPFAQALHGEYMRLAYAEGDEDDWDDAVFFAGKAQAAADAANEGSMIPDPQMVSEREIPEDSVIILTVAYDDLTEALADGRRTKPNSAAIAQAAFDCWLQELEENIQPEHIEVCRDDFDSAMERLTASAEPGTGTQAGPFMVFFGFNSAELDSAALSLINTLAEHEIAKNENGEISIVGHTDSSGSADYNDDLSMARVSAVGKALAEAGVAANIYMSALGEEMLMMDTGDGVKDAKNRRVEIRLEQ